MVSVRLRRPRSLSNESPWTDPGRHLRLVGSDAAADHLELPLTGECVRPARHGHGPPRWCDSAQSEHRAHCGTRTLSRQRVDVDDKPVVDRQQDERQHPVVAHGDDADPIADGQMQQRR
jgi:hypothetical protein